MRHIPAARIAGFALIGAVYTLSSCSNGSSHGTNDVDASAGTGGTSASGGTGGTAQGGAAGIAAGGAPAGGASNGIRLTQSPWGVAPSHSSSVGIASWASAIAATHIDWIRGFDQANTDAVLATATSNGFQVSGILFLSDPGPTTTFPVNSIPAWKDYVTTSVQNTAATVHNWEVWNEPPNFSDDKSPADYATIVAAAYDAAKAADSSVNVGLAAQSVNLNFLAQALDAGAADHFDYVTVHPYETMGLVASGWEAEYMSIVPTIRKMLADKSPANKNVPVWFTEVGEPVQNEITPELQADTVVKAYVMGIAQGALRVHWFEPLDGDSGPFGLIAGGDGSAPKRPSYTAVTKLIEALGQKPHYMGWLLLDSKHYGFVFDGPKGPVMVAWARPNANESVELGGSVTITDPRTGTTTQGTSVALTNSPVLVSGFPNALVTQATTNLSKPFPWDGDYSNATSVSYTAATDAKGLHPLGAASIVTIDGGPARDISQFPGQSFTVDPSYLSYTSTPIRITAVVRRNAGAASAGFNLKYESTTGWKGTGNWYSIPGSDQWYTQTWDITDDQFVGKWGYNFGFDSDSTANSNYSIQGVTVTKQ